MKIVYIEWLDACSYQGWMDLTDDSPDTASITTIGYLAEEDDKQVLITSSLSETGNILGAVAIPKGWIRKRRNIKI